MDRSQIPRLKSLTVRARPLTCHALSWSNDAELAVATDEAVHVFIPEFPKACAGEDKGPSSSDRDSRGGVGVGAGPAPQYAIRFQVAGLFKPLYAVNAQLCALAGLSIPPGPNDDDRHMMVDAAEEDNDNDDDDGGGGGGDDGDSGRDNGQDDFDLRDGLPSTGRVVTGKGGSLSHVVSASWSPPGMGCNLRPVLTALGTAGNIVALGEHYSHEEDDNDDGDGNHGGSGAGAEAATARDPKNWRVLWGLGAGLPLPAEEEEEDQEEEEEEGNSSAYRTMDERIVAFDWAGEVGPGRGLLGYATDEGEAVVMSVLQFPSRGDDGAVRRFVCRLREVARFDARGPHHHHEDTDAFDPEYVPHQSAFCIRWSPWHVAADGSRTATIAYAGKNHVGFRRVTLAEPWEAERRPVLRVEESDASGMCLFLSADASVHWEDRTWTESNGDVTARGLITTPFDVKPFQVSLTTPGQQQQSPIRPHPASACSTSYPANPLDNSRTNPITGLVIHAAGDLGSKPPFPLFTAVRASATSLNNDWYETNLPDPTVATSATAATAATSRLLPKWVKKISAATARSVPRTRALEGLDPDSDSDSDSDSGPDEYGSDAPVEDHESSIMVCPERYGVAGLAQSPGGGCTAVLAARYDTAHPCRRPVFRVLFGRGYGGSPATTATTATQNNTAAAASAISEGVNKELLTAEGRVWEDMYSKGKARKHHDHHHHHHHHHHGQEDAAQAANDTSPSSHLRALFAPLLEKQTCVFCDQRLDGDGFEATCPDGHVFAICTSSGLAILAPGISRVCGVCGRRSLTDRQLRRAARDVTAPAESSPSSSSSFWCSDVCGSCGGKFIA
ncbi:hypothetical protein N3K66_002762 [Trichothecium roseum]|uniref:Uncharacterized protein n=1 Tax=Trichothecium roseum TaxID=47278 RepID=A0ACC0VCH4_9HYPO|nr:hypothetical protein N3K66_002762 [Trichothecium roseum]